jgi:hypothetical protein
VGRPLFRGGDVTTNPGQTNIIAVPFEWRFSVTYIGSHDAADTGVTTDSGGPPMDDSTPSGCDNLSDYQDAWAYAIPLWRASAHPNGTAIADALRAALRESFIHCYFYSSSVATGWAAYYGVGLRGRIRVGTHSGMDERIHGWHTRRGEHYYLFKELELQEGGTF